MVEFVLNNIKDVAVIALSIVVLLVLGLAAFFAVKLIKKLFEKFGIQLEESQMQRIESIVVQVVKWVNQTLTSEFKKLNPDSKLTEEQKEEAYNKALAEILDILDDVQKDMLAEKYGTVNAALDIMIECAVSDQHTVSETKKSKELPPLPSTSEIKEEEFCENLQTPSDNN